MKNFCTTLIIVISAMVGNYTYATVAPISPGENMWKIISRIESTNTSSITALQSLSPTCTSITTVPYTISVAGNYCLGTNVTISGVQTAIVIATSNVYLDLANNEIIGAGGVTTGISVGNGFSNVTIANGLINGVTTGIQLTNTAPTVRINNVTIQATTTGISAASNCSGILLDYVSISNTPTAINCNNMLSSVFTNCTINNATTTAITLTNASSYNVIKNCNFYTGTNGIVYSNTSLYNCLINCNFANQVVKSVDLGSSSFNVIDASSFEGTGTTNFAIVASATTSALIRNCTLNGNTNGINADNSTNIVITGCSITGTGAIVSSGISTKSAPTAYPVNNVVRNHAINYDNPPAGAPIVLAASITGTNAGFWTNISG